MDESLPVFSRRQEVELWKTISAAFAIPQAEKKEKQYGILLQSVRDIEKPVASPILEQMIYLAYDIKAEKWMDDVSELVSMQRKGDCRASLAAANCMARQSQNTAAYAYLDAVSQVSDRARFSKAKGDILMAMNNREGAAKAYKDALRSDPLDTDVYVKMADLEPETNWMAICACERMFLHMEYQRPPPEPRTPDLDLFAIYDEFMNGDRNRAAAMLRDHPLLQDPQSYDFRILAARMALRDRNIADARQFYEEAVVEAPEVSLICEAAQSYLEGEPDTAVALTKFRDAESNDPGNKNVVHGLVRTYIMSGKPTEAVDVLRVFLKTEFAGVDQYIYAADRMIECGFIEDAVRTVELVLTNYPDEPHARITMSRASLEKADFITARQHAKAAIRLLPNDPDAYAQLSKVYTALKVTRLARKYAEKAVALENDKVSIEANTALMDVCYADGAIEKTMEIAEKILAIDPENVHAHNMLSEIRIEMAVQSQDNLVLEVNDAEDVVRLVQRLVHEGRFEDAEMTCQKYSALMQQRPVLLQLLGNAQYAQGKYIQASASFSEAASKSADSAILWHSKGMADEKIGDLQSASEAFDRAVVLDQGNPRYWISRGCVYQARGKNQLA